MKIINILAILLLTLSFVQAIDSLESNIIINKYNLVDEFEVSSHSTVIESCSCSPKISTINIYNSGNVANRYTISSNLEFATISQTIVSLKPKESQEVTVFIDTPCKESKTNLEITVRSTTNQEKLLVQEIRSNVCVSYALKGENTTKSHEPCELQVHEFTIFNTANFKDEYSFSSDYELEYSENPVKILPMSNRTIFAYYQPDCSLYGVDEIEVVVENAKTPLKASINLVSVIERNYDFSVVVPQNINQCNKEYSEYKFTITNDANIANQYNFDLNAPSFARLSNNIVELGPHETKNLSIIIAPNLKEAGDFLANVTITSVLGDLVENKLININVEDCYTFNIKPAFDGRLLTCSDDSSIFFEIENTGTKTNTYNLGLETDVASLDNNTITIEPNSSKKILVRLNLTDKNSKESVKLVAKTFSNDFIEDASQKLKIISKAECYEAKTNLKNSYKFKQAENNISFNLTNNGLKKVIYDISLLGQEWVGLSNQLIALEPLESKEVRIFIDARNISPDKYYESLRIGFADKYETFKDFKIKIIDKTIFEKIKDYFSPEKTVPKTNCTELFSKNICNYRYFEFYENQKYELNLSIHYYDPDGDKLTYGVVNNSDNLRVKVRGDIAFIKASDYGVGQAIFSAMDAENSTNSDVFYFQVIDEPNNWFRISIGKYWILYLLVVLLIIVLLAIFFVKSSDGEGNQKESKEKIFFEQKVKQEEQSQKNLTGKTATKNKKSTPKPKKKK